MSWNILNARAAQRDLWLTPTGPTDPEYGRWVTPSGLDVTSTLGEQGPNALDVEWWLEQSPEHRGTRLVDVLWASMLDLKIFSTTLCDLLISEGVALQVFDIDVRLRNQEPVQGYQGVLEPTDADSEVHSLWQGRRSHVVVVSDRIRSVIDGAKITGIDWEPYPHPFPGDAGYLDDDED